MKSVALSAGHYTLTVGNWSPDKRYYEYEFNWDVSLKIQSHLERCGITVYRTREKVTDPTTLQQRVALGNSKKVDLYYSTHSNALNGAWSSARGCSVHLYPGADQTHGKIILNSMFPAMTNKYGLGSRGIVEQDLYELRTTRMSAVLVENAFHSNQDDVNLLVRQDFRRDMAELQAKGICKCLDVAWVEGKKLDLEYTAIGKTTIDWAVVRKTPSPKGEELSQLNKTCRVEIIHAEGDWYKIAYGADYGYIKKSEVDTNGAVVKDVTAKPKPEPTPTPSVPTEKSISITELKNMGYTSIILS